MLKKYTTLFLVACVIVLPVTAYCLADWYTQSFGKLPVYGEKGHTISEFSLKAQDGSVETKQSWTNKIVVANYFFTHCGSICPKMMYELKRVRAAFPDATVLLNSFSVDPERDTVARLKLYAEQFGISGNWRLLTGDKVQLYRLARKSFLLTVTDGDGGPNDFIHSEQLVLIDRHQQIRGFYKGTDEKEVAQLINDIKKLLHEAY
jgi:protein SCO1/2